MDGHAQPTPVAPGTLLAGKYRVEHVLGRGAMGVVVAARHQDLGELFAIKLLLPSALAIPQAVDRFLREARAAARLKSEHVVKVTDVGRLEDGSPYMVMEHLTGTDLQQLVRSRGPLPLGDAVDHVLQACDAIAEAHAMGIIHRDLKPSNLFVVRRRNGTACVKVLDFGISKQVVEGAVDLTGTTDVFGTPLYMAPEQMARSKNADARSDIWSMGVVLYQLLTGTTPFQASTVTEIVARVLQEDALPLRAHRPDLPPGLDAVVGRCLQKRPDLRFQSIDDLAAALRALAVPAGVPAPRLPSSPSIAASFGSAPSLPTAPGTPPYVEAAPANPSATPPGAPVHTASSFGATSPLPGSAAARARTGGVVLALGIAGVLALLFAVGGVWLAVRPPVDPSVSGVSEPGPAASPTAEPFPAPVHPPSSPPTAVEPSGPAPTVSVAPAPPRPSPAPSAAVPTAEAPRSPAGPRPTAAPRPAKATRKDGSFF